MRSEGRKGEKTMSSYTSCPACSSKAKAKTAHHSVFTCKTCKAIYGDCYLGESYGIVKPWFASAEVAPEKTRYFDFMTLGSKGIERRHGWYDPATGLITQTG
jgi:ribosomal protein L37AE/L43A